MKNKSDDRRLPRSYFEYQGLSSPARWFALWGAVERLEDEVDRLNKIVRRLKKKNS